MVSKKPVTVSTKPGPKKMYHLPDDIVQIAELVARATAPTYNIVGEEAVKGAVRLAGEVIAAKMREQNGE